MRVQSIKMMLIALLCALWLVPFSSYAEAGTVIISSDTSVEVGDTLTVTVKYAASSLGLIEGELRYDPDMLTYISGGTVGDPNAGVVTLSKEMKGEKEQLFTIRFKAVGSGSDFFLVNTFQLKDKENTDLGKPGASVKLIVTKIQSQPSVEEPVVTPEDPVVAPEDPITDPTTETPDATENPAKDAETETAPNTLWVFAGAIAVTTALLLISLLLVNRKKKLNQ